MPRDYVGRRRNSDPAVKAERESHLVADPYAHFTPEERDAKRKECAAKSVLAKKQARNFKIMFEEYLTEDKRTSIVQEFIEILCNSSVPVKDRTRVFELILRIIGEDGTITPSDRQTLNNIIELQFT